MRICMFLGLLFGQWLKASAETPLDCEFPLVWTLEPACRIHDCVEWRESGFGNPIYCDFPPLPGCFCPDGMPLQLTVDGEVFCLTEGDCLDTICRQGEIPSLCGVPQPCTATCQDPVSDLICPPVCVIRCECKPNKPLWDPTRQRCVKAEDCDPCILDKKEGPCEADIKRWYFDLFAGCVEFSWGGCFPNANNFETADACFEACGLPCPIWDCFFSICPAGFKTDSQGCQKGCKCNCPCKNVDCGPGEICVVDGEEAVCVKQICEFGQPVHNIPPPITCATVDCAPGYGCEQVDGYATCCPGSVCLLNPDSGCGKKTWERWYYNPASQDCIMFVYGGSAGNENNFLTEADCLNQCAAP